MNEDNTVMQTADTLQERYSQLQKEHADWMRNVRDKVLRMCDCNAETEETGSTEDSKNT